MRTGVGASLASAGDNIVNASSTMQIRSNPRSGKHTPSNRQIDMPPSFRFDRAGHWNDKTLLTQ